RSYCTGPREDRSPLAPLRPALLRPNWHPDTVRSAGRPSLGVGQEGGGVVAEVAPRDVQAQGNEVVLRAGVGGLRQAFACRYLESGGSLAVLQELLGQSTVRMTQHYARLADDYARREFERLDDQTVGGTVAGPKGAVR